MPVQKADPVLIFQIRAMVLILKSRVEKNLMFLMLGSKSTFWFLGGNLGSNVILPIIQKIL
jgi:hypothetical protein